MAGAKRTGYREGGSLAMPYSEQAQARTFKNLAKPLKSDEAGSSFRDALSRDFKYIREIVKDPNGKLLGKYNEGMQELIKYYNGNFPHLM